MSFFGRMFGAGEKHLDSLGSFALSQLGQQQHRPYLRHELERLVREQQRLLDDGSWFRTSPRPIYYSDLWVTPGEVLDQYGDRVRRMAIWEDL